MNLASNTAPLGSTRPSRVAAIHLIHRVLHPPLHVFNDVAGVALVPAPIELFGHRAELNDQIFGEIFGLDLTSLFAPQADEQVLVVTHNHPRIRSADKRAAICVVNGPRKVLRHVEFSL